MLQKLTVWRPSKAVISASSLGFGTCTLSAIFRLIFRADGRGKGSDVPGKSTTETRGASNVPWVIWIDGRCIFRINTLCSRSRGKRGKIILPFDRLAFRWSFEKVWLSGRSWPCRGCCSFHQPFGISSRKNPLTGRHIWLRHPMDTPPWWNWQINQKPGGQNQPHHRLVLLCPDK